MLDLLLLPRFCYVEILGLALFVLWLRWSLCQKTIFTLASCKDNVSSCPCRIFHFSLPPVRVNSAPSLWPVHKSKNTTFYFFSFLCVTATFFCLSLCHAFKWNATTATWVCKCINLATPSVSCFQLVCEYTSETVDIYRFALCRSGMLARIWRNEVFDLAISRNCTIFLAFFGQ